MKYVTQLYIGFTALMILAAGYYFYVKWEYPYYVKEYEGFVTYAFEWSTFTPCTKDMPEGEWGLDELTVNLVGYDWHKQLYDPYNYYFTVEYRPVYVKIRAEIHPEVENDEYCCTFSKDYMLLEKVIDVQTYERRKCEAPVDFREYFKDAFIMAPVEERFKYWKEQSLNKVLKPKPNTP